MSSPSNNQSDFRPAMRSAAGQRTVTSRQGVLTKEECQAILDRCMALSKGGGEVHVAIWSVWSSGVQWARNRAYLARDVHDIRLSIQRTIRGARGSVTVTRCDDEGLREAIGFAEQSLQYHTAGALFDERPRAQISTPILQPTLWSDATYAFDGEKRGEVARQLIEPVEAAGLLTAGELRVTARSFATMSTQGMSRYYPTTRVMFSTTTRDKKGTASGWAGTDDFDVTRVDMTALAARALKKCIMSQNPVAIEPGRYTVILEPQAVADLFGPLSTWDIPHALDRAGPFGAESGRGPFAGAVRGTSKIGTRVVDPRLTWSADPMDPVGGFLPFDVGSGMSYAPVRWIDQGVLRDLSYDTGYALYRLGRETALLDPRSWRLSGGTTSTEEMIATTKRGVLVTRFHNVSVSDFDSFTCTGYTRDGLWLIENGKITKPIKNFRFTESPLFIFNRLDQLGPSQRVFSDDTPWREWAWVAPAAKVHDFNFTQLSDAV